MKTIEKGKGIHFWFGFTVSVSVSMRHSQIKMGNLLIQFLNSKCLISEVKVRYLTFRSTTKFAGEVIYCAGNRSKQIQETHTAYCGGTQYTRQSLNEKQYAWLHRQKVIVCELCVKPCRLFIIQTLSRILPSFKLKFSLGFITSCYVIFSLSMVQAMDIFMIT